MARYLTPAKVGLLALISIYSDSRVPIAATIPILSFIVGHLLALGRPDGEPVTEGACAQSSFLDAVEDFQKATITHASAIPGRTIWDLLLKTLWEINSFDALDVFFQKSNASLVRTREEQTLDAERDIEPSMEGQIRFSRTSPVGVFLRRAQLEFTRLQFHDTVSLWQAFVRYREPTLHMWRKRNPLAGETSFDINIESAGLDWGERLTGVVYGPLLNESSRLENTVSTDDVERLLEFQVREMQKMGARIPQSLREQFRKMIESNVTVPSLSHYAKFLDAWRAGDYPSSFDNLHRYFDYTMQNRDRTFYHYALLNLAILQADFGCYSEALSAIQETIATARENRDLGCLNFSLSWLFHLGKAHPSEIKAAGMGGLLGAEREGLTFLKAKAKETCMWSLWSISFLYEAKLGIANGESIPAAFENILKSSHLNITRNMINGVASQMLLSSALWHRLGVTHLAFLSCEMFLSCYASAAPAEDVAKCVCQAAYLLGEKGRYGDALLKLEEIQPESLRSLNLSQYCAIFSGLLKLKRELHHDNLNVADRLLSQLLTPRSPDPDIAFEIDLCHIDLLTRRGNLSLAMSKVETLSTSMQDTSADIWQRVRLLILKAGLLDRCGRPQKGFSLVMRAASIAWRARLMIALWHAMVAIANILVHLEEFDAARRILISVMPQVLETEDTMLCAKASGILVDACMGLAGKESAGTIKRKEWLAKAVEGVDCAFAEFSHIEDIKGQCEMMAKKATIMHCLGELQLADDCAAKYLDLKREALEGRE